METAHMRPEQEGPGMGGGAGRLLAQVLQALASFMNFIPIWMKSLWRVIFEFVVKYR